METFITKAALARAPAKLVAMHSSIPNVSSRLVFQSQPAQPLHAEADKHDLGSSALSSISALSSFSQHSSSSVASWSSSSDYELSPRHQSPGPQKSTMPTHGSQQLLHTHAAPESAAAASEAVGNGLPVQQSPQSISQVQATQQRPEELSELQATSRPAVPAAADNSGHALTTMGVRRPTPLLIPTDILQSSEAVQTPDHLGSGGTDGVAEGAVASVPRRQRHKSALQGVTARNQAAVAAHQARLAALQQKEKSKQPHGFGSSAAGHADLTLACRDRGHVPEEAQPGSPLAVQRSSGSTSRYNNTTTFEEF